VKIADFGISQMLHATDQKLADAAGTPAFMSPELCEGVSFSGQLADIWAIGATIFMLRFGHPPFIAKNIMNLYSKIINDPVVYPFMIDPGLRNLLENILVKDPNERFTLEQVFKHPWLRCPPSNQLVQHISNSVKAHNANINNNNNHVNNNVNNKTNNVNNDDKKIDTVIPINSQTLKLITNTSELTFKPPPSYDVEEAVASSAPVKTVDNNELFMSIGLRVKKNKNIGNNKENKNIAEGDEDNDTDNDDDDNDEDELVEDFLEDENPTVPIEEQKYQQQSDGFQSNTNILKTNWGNDVFQMVEDEEVDEEDDVDEDEEEEVPKTRNKLPLNRNNLNSDKNKIVMESKQQASNNSDLQQLSLENKTASNASEDIFTSTTTAITASHTTMSSLKATYRSQMSQDEENERANRFKKQIISKKITYEDSISTSSPSYFCEQQLQQRPQQLTTSSIQFPDSKNISGIKINSFIPSTITNSSSKSIGKYSSKNSPQISRKSDSRDKNSVSRLSNTDIFEEATDELSIEEFEQMMDTLAMQHHKRNSDDKIDDEDDIDDENVHTADDALDLSFTTQAGFSAQLRNSKNSLAAAFHSEQGVRQTQEDRCILLPNMAEMKALESYEFEHIGVKEQLNNFSLACVFDGHNGWRCAQYLSQNISGLLATNDRFLEKNVEIAIKETCSTLDKQVI
jgi:hypothetical protein